MSELPPYSYANEYPQHRARILGWFGGIAAFVILLVLLAMVASCGTTGKAAPATTSAGVAGNAGPTLTAGQLPVNTAPPLSAPPTPAGPKGDATVGEITIDAQLDWASVGFTVTNSSSKASDYVVIAKIVTPDGKTAIMDCLGSIQALAPGANEPGQAMCAKALPDGKTPADFTAIIGSVDRTEHRG